MNLLRYSNLVDPRLLFAGILSVAVIGGAAITLHLSTPAVSYDYFIDALPKTQQDNITTWIDGNIAHEKKLSAKDKGAFIRIIEASDRGQHTTFDRPVYIDQAGDAVAESSCTVKFEFCDYSILIAREVTPNFVHGDMRIISLTEKALRITVRRDNSAETISILSTDHQTRNIRFMFTLGGWVQKTSEVTSNAPLRNHDKTLELSEKLSGINYYPSSAPWNEFWTEFPEDEILKDLLLIKNLGGNSVRIFLNHADFTAAESKDLSKARLIRFLNFCEDYDIKVVVTLFDLRPQYQMSNWAQDAKYVDDIVGQIGDHPALFAIDLKNQADLDFENWGQDSVTTWLGIMAHSARAANPDIKLTIGWSDYLAVDAMTTNIDFISYHDYRDLDDLSSRLSYVKAKANGKPVMITEIGTTRWSPFSTKGKSAKKQAQRLQTQLSGLNSADGIFVWTLNDFDHVSTDVVGRRPWRRKQQQHFGLYNVDGAPLPAAQIFKNHNSNL